MAFWNATSVSFAPCLRLECEGPLAAAGRSGSAGPCTCCRGRSGCTSCGGSGRRPRPSTKTRSHASSIASAQSFSPRRRRRVSPGSGSPLLSGPTYSSRKRPRRASAAGPSRSSISPASGPSTQSVIGTLMPYLRRQTISCGSCFWSASLRTCFSEAPRSLKVGGSADGAYVPGSPRRTWRSRADLPSAPLVGREELQHPALDTGPARRPLRRAGAAGDAGRGSPRVLPPAPPRLSRDTGGDTRSRRTHQATARPAASVQAPNSRPGASEPVRSASRPATTGPPACPSANAVAISPSAAGASVGPTSSGAGLADRGRESPQRRAVDHRRDDEPAGPGRPAPAVAMPAPWSPNISTSADARAEPVGQGAAEQPAADRDQPGQRPDPAGRGGVQPVPLEVGREERPVDDVRDAVQPEHQRQPPDRRPPVDRATASAPGTALRADRRSTGRASAGGSRRKAAATTAAASTPRRQPPPGPPPGQRVAGRQQQRDQQAGQQQPEAAAGDDQARGPASERGGDPAPADRQDRHDRERARTPRLRLRQRRHQETVRQPGRGETEPPSRAARSRPPSGSRRARPAPRPAPRR